LKRKGIRFKQAKHSKKKKKKKKKTKRGIPGLQSKWGKNRKVRDGFGKEKTIMPEKESKELAKEKKQGKNRPAQIKQDKKGGL